MAEALDTSEKRQFHLVTFTFGDPVQTLRFTNWDSDIDPQGLNFVSLPRMDIKPAKNEGTFGEDPTRIKMQLEDASTFLDPLTRGTPFAPVAVTVEEIIDPAAIGDTGASQFIAAGIIYRTRRNANGKNGLIVIEIRNRKTQLDVALSFQVNAQCVWRLNGPGCTEPGAQSPSGYATTDIAIAIDGKVISINDVGLNFDLAGTRSWSRGFIRRDNVNIGIFFYDKATFDGLAAKEFQLVRQPPVEWEGQQVTFFPGCNKEPGDGGCGVTAWDNLEGFGGSGHAIPAYHPVTENPQGE